METCLLNHFLLNKEFKSTCDFNPVVLKQGNGIYELVRIIEQKPLFLEEHIDRFFRSLKWANIQSDINSHQITNRIKALIEINQLKNGNIRFEYLVHPQNETLFLAWISPAFYPSAGEYLKGVKLSSLQAERENPNAKRNNLPVREQANQLIQQNDVFEVLLINKEGYITEGSRSNVFFVDGEKIVTPPLSAVLPGVTRSKIISLVKENGIAIDERPIFFTDISCFDAVFLSGTSIKILPVNQVDIMSFAPSHPIIEKIQKLYEESTISYMDRYSW